MRLRTYPGCLGKHSAKGLCFRCYSRERARRKANPETRAKEAAAKRAKRAQDPQAARDKQRAWRQQNLDHDRKTQRNWYRRTKCNFSEALVERCHEYQKGRCAICPVVLVRGMGPAGEAADHCHKTKAPRGLLCHTCNRSLGMYERNQRPAGLVIDPYEYYLNNTPVSRLNNEPR